MSPFHTAACIVALAAVVTDLRARRVPNTLSGTAVLGGIVAHAFAPGGHGVLFAALGCLVGLAIFFPVFALGGLGAGDVKLMAALGTWLGPGAAVWVALYGAIAGGVLAIIVSLATGYLRQALTNIRGLFLFWAAEGVKPLPSLTLDRGRGPRLPYAVPIFFGLVATLWRMN